MIDRTELKQTMRAFHSQASRLMRTTPDDFQSDLAKFVSYINEAPFIGEYIDECIAQHTPEGFDVKEEIEAVRSSMGAVFGPFGGSDEQETAEIALILRELVSQGATGRSMALLYGYSGGSTKYQDMIDGFLDRVVRILVDHIEGHLASKGIAMGLDEKGTSVFVDMSGSTNSQLNVATGGSSISAVQQNGQSQALEALLRDLISSTEGMSADIREVVEENAQMIRDELSSGAPRKGALGTMIKSLKVILAGTNALASLTAIAEFLGLGV